MIDNESDVITINIINLFGIITLGCTKNKKLYNHNESNPTVRQEGKYRSCIRDSRDGILIVRARNSPRYYAYTRTMQMAISTTGDRCTAYSYVLASYWYTIDTSTLQ